MRTSRFHPTLPHLGIAAYLLLISPLAAQPVSEVVSNHPRTTGAEIPAQTNAAQLGEPVPENVDREDKEKLSPDQAYEVELREFGFRGGDLDLPRPNVELPSQVVAEQGRLTLFADYKNPEPRGVPLYLVNRTSEAIALPLESGGLRVQLERQLPSGAWERAQERVYADCGLAYGGASLPPAMHVRFLGYQPVKRLSEPGTIRFVRYGNMPLVSNAGVGAFAKADLEKARRDDLSLRAFPFQIQKEFIRVGARLDKPRTLSGRIACLRIAELAGEHPEIKVNAQRWLEQLEALPEPTPDERQAITIAKTILGRDWGEKKGSGPLLRACLDAVQNPEQVTVEFGSLASEPKLAWTILGEMARIEIGPEFTGAETRHFDRNLWREILDLALTKLPAASQEERSHVMSVLWNPRLLDETLHDEVFERLLLTDDKNLAQTAAKTLMRRGRSEKLAEVALALPANRRATILTALSDNMHILLDGDPAEFESRRLPRKFGPREEEFWNQALQNQPLQLAAFFVSHLKKPPFAPHDLANLVRSHWQAELKRIGQAERDYELTNEESEVAESLGFISYSKQPQDIELLLSLLNHRGYRKIPQAYLRLGESEPDRFVIRHFVVRKMAADALRRLGQEVPPGIVFQVEVNPDGSPR